MRSGARDPRRAAALGRQHRGLETDLRTLAGAHARELRGEPVLVAARSDNQANDSLSQRAHARSRAHLRRRGGRRSAATRTDQGSVRAGHGARRRDSCPLRGSRAQGGLMKTMAKYLAFARVAAVEALHERAELYGRVLFFGVLLGVFSALWRAVAEAGMPLAAEHHELVWYLAATEWILLSTPQRQQDIQEEVRRGDVAYQLARPASFARGQLAQCWGALLVRAPVLGAAALVWLYLFTGSLPDLRALCWLAPFGLLASAVLAQLVVALGLLSFWLTDATPLYWVATKLLVVVGGLMLPVELAPQWLQVGAGLRPFPPLLSEPAGVVLHGPAAALKLLPRLLLGAVWLFALVELLFWRAA